MYKFYSFCLLFAFALQINAQITLTSSNNIPNVGDSYDYYYILDYTFDVSQTGANQTWDFSSASGGLATINFMDPSGSLDAASFPEANLVSGQTIAGRYTEHYYSSSSSGLSLVGQYSPPPYELKYIYTDLREYLKFPITYNDIFNETFSGTYEFSLETHDLSGTIEINADGYGDLILPYTTVHNVLKINITSNYTDTYMGTTIYSTEVTNVWYDTSNRLYLASTTKDYQGATLWSSTAMYLSQSDLILGVDDSHLKDSQIAVYPNPASNGINIKNSTGEVLNAKIVDISGRNIETLTVDNGDQKIDVSNLESGVYFIKLAEGSKTLTKELVVN